MKKFLKPSKTVHHFDETYIKVKGKQRYLYRAVDSSGNSIDFYLSPKKDKVSAIQFLTKAISQSHATRPGTIVTDKNPSYHAAITELKRANILNSTVRHVMRKRRSNIIESDHRFIKRRVRHSQCNDCLDTLQTFFQQEHFFSPLIFNWYFFKKHAKTVFATNPI